MDDSTPKDLFEKPGGCMALGDVWEKQFAGCCVFAI